MFHLVDPCITGDTQPDPTCPHPPSALTRKPRLDAICSTATPSSLVSVYSMPSRAFLIEPSNSARRSGVNRGIVVRIYLQAQATHARSSRWAVGQQEARCEGSGGTQGIGAGTMAAEAHRGAVTLACSASDSGAATAVPSAFLGRWKSAGTAAKQQSRPFHTWWPIYPQMEKNHVCQFSR